MIQLTTGVHLARVGDHAVILDLGRDKYLALPPALANAALSLAGVEHDIQRCDLATARAALERQGLRVDGAQAARIAEPPMATASLWPRIDIGPATARRRPGFAGMLAVQAALCATWLSLRWLPFRRTIAWVGARGVRARPSPVQDLLDEYAAARPWFPAHLVCRLDAMALCLHLRRGGQPAKLVFGVRLEPFLAHCWVQCGEVVINEPSDIVRRYTPILAV